MSDNNYRSADCCEICFHCGDTRGRDGFPHCAILNDWVRVTNICDRFQRCRVNAVYRKMNCDFIPECGRMKGKLDENGVLSIERLDNWKMQKCIMGLGFEYCSDSCPKMGEPFSALTGNMCVDICNGEFIEFESFDDER